MVELYLLIILSLVLASTLGTILGGLILYKVYFNPKINRVTVKYDSEMPTAEDNPYLDSDGKFYTNNVIDRE